MFFGKYLSKIRQRAKGLDSGGQSLFGIRLKMNSQVVRQGKNPRLFRINWDELSESTPDDVYIKKPNTVDQRGLKQPYTGEPENKSVGGHESYTELNPSFYPFSMINEAGIFTGTINKNGGYSINQGIFNLARYKDGASPALATVKYEMTDGHTINGFGTYSINNQSISANRTGGIGTIDFKELPNVEVIFLNEANFDNYKNWPRKLKALWFGELRPVHIPNVSNIDPLPESVVSVQMFAMLGYMGSNFNAVFANCVNMKSLFMQQYSPWPITRAGVIEFLPANLDLSFSTQWEELSICATVSGLQTFNLTGLPNNQLKFFEIASADFNDGATLSTLLGNQSLSLRGLGVHNCPSNVGFNFNLTSAAFPLLETVILYRSGAVGTMDFSAPQLNLTRVYLERQGTANPNAANPSYPIVDLSGLSNLTLFLAPDSDIIDLELPVGAPVTDLSVDKNAIDITTNPNILTQIYSYANTMRNLDFNYFSSVVQNFGATIDLSAFTDLRTLSIANQPNLTTINLPSVSTNFTTLELRNNSALNGLPLLTTVNNISAHNNTIILLYISYCDSLIFDFSGLTKIDTLICEYCAAQIVVDISALIYDGNGMNNFTVRQNTSLTTLTFPVDELNSRYRNSINANDNPALTTVNNLDKLNFLFAGRIINFNGCTNLNQVLPIGQNTGAWQARSLLVANAAMNQASCDGTIDSIYQNRAKFELNLCTLRLDGGTSATPGGIYQPPAGFVLGSADGTPVSALEQVYVLVNNYGWNILYN